MWTCQVLRALPLASQTPDQLIVAGPTARYHGIFWMFGPEISLPKQWLTGQGAWSPGQMLMLYHEQMILRVSRCLANFSRLELLGACDLLVAPACGTWKCSNAAGSERILKNAVDETSPRYDRHLELFYHLQWFTGKTPGNHRKPL